MDEEKKKKVKRVAEKAGEDVVKGAKEGVEAIKSFGKGVKKEINKHKD
ncbi:hypothetical protein MUP77_23000 [Candidatus Bathyarchaeota archaeon]|nr:hypothetical protein [Candidatus Bathyarchaeota archaeon]